MVAAGGVVGGLVLGIALGVLAGAVLRSWLSWREWAEASREARLTEDVLERMERQPWRSTR